MAQAQQKRLKELENEIKILKEELNSAFEFGNSSGYEEGYNDGYSTGYLDCKKDIEEEKYNNIELIERKYCT